MGGGRGGGREGGQVTLKIPFGGVPLALTRHTNSQTICNHSLIRRDTVCNGHGLNLRLLILQMNNADVDAI